MKIVRLLQPCIPAYDTPFKHTIEPELQVLTPEQLATQPVYLQQHKYPSVYHQPVLGTNLDNSGQLDCSKSELGHVRNQAGIVEDHGGSQRTMLVKGVHAHL